MNIYLQRGKHRDLDDSIHLYGLQLPAERKWHKFKDHIYDLPSKRSSVVHSQKDKVVGEKGLTISPLWNRGQGGPIRTVPMTTMEPHLTVTTRSADFTAASDPFKNSGVVPLYPFLVVLESSYTI